MTGGIFTDSKSVSKRKSMSSCLIPFALISWHKKKNDNKSPKSIKGLRSNQKPGNEVVPGEE